VVWFKESISQKKKFLSSLIKVSLRSLEDQSRACWQDADALTAILQNDLCKLPHCQLLYAIGTDGKQISSNVTRNGLDNSWRGQDLTQRPYLCGNLPYKGMVLSAVYLSQRSMQPCITAVQAVADKEQLLGFIAADFHIKDLPEAGSTGIQHRALAGNGGKKPQRKNTKIDDNIDYLIYVLSTLMQEHGIFQAHVHFDSGACTISSLEDPLRYQIFNVQELMDPELFLLYSKCDYDLRATIKPERIPNVFAQLKALRNLDDEVYLRSGSLNIMNGQIGLSFSCDGTHYIGTDEFLNRDLTSWLSTPNADNLFETITPN
jgi:hypothetical protein